MWQRNLYKFNMVLPIVMLSNGSWLDEVGWLSPWGAVFSAEKMLQTTGAVGDCRGAEAAGLALLPSPLAATCWFCWGLAGFNSSEVSWSKKFSAWLEAESRCWRGWSVTDSLALEKYWLNDGADCWDCRVGGGTAPRIGGLVATGAPVGPDMPSVSSITDSLENEQSKNNSYNFPNNLWFV